MLKRIASNVAELMSYLLPAADHKTEWWNRPKPFLFERIDTAGENGPGPPLNDVTATLLAGKSPSSQTGKNRNRKTKKENNKKKKAMLSSYLQTSFQQWRGQKCLIFCFIWLGSGHFRPSRDSAPNYSATRKNRFNSFLIRWMNHRRKINHPLDYLRLENVSPRKD